MCATFAQAVRRTKPTAAIITRSVGRTSPTTFSVSETTSMFRFVPGNAFSRRAVIAAISARADATVAPSARRPKRRRLCMSRRAQRSPSASGAKSCAFVAQNGANEKPLGMTPTTV